MSENKDVVLLELAKTAQKDFANDILLARVDGKLWELFKSVPEDTEGIQWVTAAEASGMLTYRNSAVFMMIKAVKDIYPEAEVTVEYSISKGYFCQLKGGVSPDEEFIDKVTKRMNELQLKALPLTKKSVKLEEGLKKFCEENMYEKERLFKYRRISQLNIYELDGYYDYFYGYLVPDTSYIKYYKLYPYKGGFVIQMPVKENPQVVPEFRPQEKLFNTLKEASEWGEKLDVENVGALNDAISSGNINELILVQEALQEKKIAEIAQMIIDKPTVKFVMIAGPSSSGKTTFSHRLSIQLRTHGIKPHPIGLDDYFLNRDKTPRDADGKYNFECLEALDIEQFNSDMTRLLNGETVEMPRFNFVTGCREYKGDFLKLGKDDILVIEGIHGLNDKLSYSLDNDSKFKIYISALTQLNIDEHNRIPTTDGRLIRRMVRDARTRGASAKKTIGMWQSVRAGEEQNIFPYQESADVMFNSALVYELAVLKQFAEPILFQIKKDEPEYEEAKRLLKFLDYFLGISSENIPHNSIMREFIGGSVFRV